MLRNFASNLSQTFSTVHQSYNVCREKPHKTTQIVQNNQYKKDTANTQSDKTQNDLKLKLDQQIPITLIILGKNNVENMM